jgi:hypothetical protein
VEIDEQARVANRSFQKRSVASSSNDSGYDFDPRNPGNDDAMPRV